MILCVFRAYFNRHLLLLLLMLFSFMFSYDILFCRYGRYDMFRKKALFAAFCTMNTGFRKLSFTFQENMCNLWSMVNVPKRGKDEKDKMCAFAYLQENELLGLIEFCSFVSLDRLSAE